MTRALLRALWRALTRLTGGKLMPKNVHDEAATMLEEVHDYIVRVGWIQGGWKSTNGVCLLQAFKDCDGAKHGVAADAEARRIFQNVIGDGNIMGWNDASGRSKTEVLTHLQAAKHVAKDLAT